MKKGARVKRKAGRIQVCRENGTKLVAVTVLAFVSGKGEDMEERTVLWV
jgi:vacuolar-type H+-ATPase catalytic subunit A/Vma1